FSLIVTHDFYEEGFDIIDLAMSLHRPDQLWSQWNTEGLNVCPTVTFFGAHSAPFRAHPRFLPLCARIGLCQYWAETRHWPDFIVDAPNRAAMEAEVMQLAQAAGYAIDAH